MFSWWRNLTNKRNLYDRSNYLDVWDELVRAVDGDAHDVVEKV